MKARIIGTDQIVECYGVCWRGEQPAASIKYLNGIYKDKSAVVPMNALKEIEIADEVKPRLSQQKDEENFIKFACVALHAILTNSDQGLGSCDFDGEECAKKAINMAKLMIREMKQQLDEKMT